MHQFFFCLFPLGKMSLLKVNILFHCFCIAPPTCWMAVHPSQHWPLRIQHVQRGDGSFLQVPSRSVVRNVPRLVPAVCPFLSVRKTPTGLSVWIAAPVGVGLWGCDVLHAPDVTGQALIKEKTILSSSCLPVSQMIGPCTPT